MLRKKIEQNKKFIIYSGIYTAAFVLLAACIFVWFAAENKSFVWKRDGLYQHFNSLAYYGQYLRGIVKTFIYSGKIEIPMWSFQIGYGSDIISTLHYYVLGDPLNLLSIFVPKAHTEVLYNCLVLLRFYLAGITFSIFCFRMKKGRYEVLLGSFLYIFCGFALTAAIRHPYFMNPMIYFPLVILGIEKILAKEKPYLFIVSVFVSAASSFYFFYMITILAVVYAAIRFFHITKENKIKNLLFTLGKFALYYLTGLCLACMIFIPVIRETLAGGRLDSEAAVELFYGQEYYSKFLLGFISPLWVGSWNIMGYTIPGALAIMFLFLKRKSKGELKLGFVVLTGILLTPVGGYVLNGFSYVSNRWIWGYSFLVAYIFVTMLPAMVKKMKRLPRPRVVMASLLVLCIVANAALLYGPWVGNYTKDFHKSGTALKKLQNNGTKAAEQVHDSSFFRYEENRYNQEVNYNSSLQTGLNSTTFYFSVANGNIFRFMNETKTNIAKSFSYAGVDGNAVLGSLASTKYFVVQEGNEQYLPYGYTEKAGEYTDLKGEKYYAYENKYALPLGSTYDKVIPAEQYEKLTAIEKQQSLLQGLVLNEEETAAESQELNFTDEEAEYTAIPGSGMELKDNKVIVNEKGAALTLEFDGKENCENYISFENLWFYPEDSATISRMKVSADGVTKRLYVRTPDNVWYENSHDFLVNTGYSKDERHEITLTFDKTGTYELDKLKVILQPMDAFAEEVEERKKDILENVNLGTNKVTGTIDLEEAKYLFLSIPYNEGWEAWVDGKKTELKKANTMYMALDLDEGSHKIKLKYTTPGVKTGAGLVIFGLFCFAGIIIFEKRKTFKDSVDKTTEHDIII